MYGRQAGRLGGRQVVCPCCRRSVVWVAVQSARQAAVVQAVQIRQAGSGAAGRTAGSAVARWQVGAGGYGSQHRTPGSSSVVYLCPSPNVWQVVGRCGVAGWWWW